MKAMLSKAAGGPDTLCLREVPVPQPTEGEVRIAVRYVGINFPDRLIIRDQYQYRPERPFAPGAELSGVVTAVGQDVTDFSIGDRVMALPMWGGFAEEVCVAALSCHKVPDAVSDADAAMIQMTYGTAYYALTEQGSLKRGETVLVLGAAGGVGLAAVELARGLGARVIAAASSDEKIKVAMDHGAHGGVVYPIGPMDKDGQKAFGADLRAALGASGADIVVDAVGGTYSEPALRCCSWGGRFLVVGFPAGIAKIPANLPLLKSCDIRGVFWGAAIEHDPMANRAAMQDLLGLCGSGKINPRVHETYEFTKAGQAIAALDSRDVKGKILVKL